MKKKLRHLIIITLSFILILNSFFIAPTKVSKAQDGRYGEVMDTGGVSFMPLIMGIALAPLAAQAIPWLIKGGKIGVTVIGGYLAARGIVEYLAGPHKCENWVKTPFPCLANAFRQSLLEVIVEFIALILRGIFQAIFQIVMFVNNYVARLTDYVLSLDPFDENVKSAELIWFILKTFAYIILVFSALLAGFQWLLGEDNNAKSLIFNIIMVALLIDFTFLFVKEAFYIVRAIEQGITGEVELSENTGAASASSRSTTTTSLSSRLGSLLVAAVWKQDPFQITKDLIAKNSQAITDGISQGDSSTGEIVKEAFIVIATNIFLTTMAFIIFIVLIVMLAIGFARYLMLIFLAGVSSFAVVSLAFPQFKPPFSAFTDLVGDVFNNWLRYVVVWLLVVPILAIMMIVGLVIQYNFFQRVTMQDNLMSFLIALLTIIGWFVISLRTAVNVSGEVGEKARKFAVGSLALVGTGAAGFIGGRISERIASGMEKVGRRLSKRAGMGWLGRRMYTASQFASKTAEGLRQKTFGEKANVASWTLKNAYSDLVKAKTDAEKQKAMNNLLNVMGEIRRNPQVASLIKDSIKSISGYALQRIAEDKNMSQQFLNVVANFDTETQEEIISRLDKSSAMRLLDHMKDSSYASQIAGLTPVLLKGLADKVGEINTENIIKLLQEGKFFQNLSDNKDKLGPLIDAINKSTKGLYNGLISASVDQVAQALRDLPEQVFREGGSLLDFISTKEGKGPFNDSEINQILSEVMTSNRDSFFRGFQRAVQAEKQKMVSYLTNFFQQNKGTLQSMVSDQDISYLAALIAAPTPQGVTQSLSDIFNTNLTNFQKNRLGMSITSSQPTTGTQLP